MKKQLIFFLVSGSLGFIVDSTVLMLLIQCDYSFNFSRLFSFFAAVTFTWYFNRNFTFKSKDRDVGMQNTIIEYIKYIFAMAFGGGVNFIVSVQLYNESLFAKNYPIFAVAIGTLAGLCINFITAKFWIFKRRFN